MKVFVIVLIIIVVIVQLSEGFWFCNRAEDEGTPIKKKSGKVPTMKEKEKSPAVPKKEKKPKGKTKDKTSGNSRRDEAPTTTRRVEPPVPDPRTENSPPTTRTSGKSRSKTTRERTTTTTRSDPPVVNRPEDRPTTTKASGKPRSKTTRETPTPTTRNEPPVVPPTSDDPISLAVPLISGFLNSWTGAGASTSGNTHETPADPLSLAVPLISSLWNSWTGAEAPSSRTEQEEPTIARPPVVPRTEDRTTYQRPYGPPPSRTTYDTRIPAGVVQSPFVPETENIPNQQDAYGRPLRRQTFDRQTPPRGGEPPFDPRTEGIPTNQGAYGPPPTLRRQTIDRRVPMRGAQPPMDPRTQNIPTREGAYGQPQRRQAYEPPTSVRRGQPPFDSRTEGIQTNQGGYGQPLRRQTYDSRIPARGVEQPIAPKTATGPTNQRANGNPPNRNVPIIQRPEPPVSIPKPIPALFSLLEPESAIDYCSKALSCGDRKEIKNFLCNAPGTFGPLCVDATIVPITDYIKNKFLRIHNEKRSFTAQGKLGRFFKTALRMATMVWDRKLQEGSLKNALRCRIDHDKCRRTRRYAYAGQNLAMSCGIPNYSNQDEVIDKAMENWFVENKDLPEEWLNAYGIGRKPRDQVGHFTQMVRDKAFAMGCSIVKSTTIDEGERWKCYYIACNYATGNLISYPVYEVGAMGANCKSGMNPNYPGLCSENENYYDDTLLFELNT